MINSANFSDLVCSSRDGGVARGSKSPVINLNGTTAVAVVGQHPGPGCGQADLIIVVGKNNELQLMWSCS